MASAAGSGCGRGHCTPKGQQGAAASGAADRTRGRGKEQGGGRGREGAVRTQAGRWCAAQGGEGQDPVKRANERAGRPAGGRANERTSERASEQRRILSTGTWEAGASDSARRRMRQPRLSLLYLSRVLRPTPPTSPYSHADLRHFYTLFVVARLCAAALNDKGV